jgi:hypothetical protein
MLIYLPLRATFPAFIIRLRSQIINFPVRSSRHILQHANLYAESLRLQANLDVEYYTIPCRLSVAAHSK